MTIGVVSSSYNGCTQENLSVSVNSQNQLSPSLGYVYDAAGNMTGASGGAGYAYNAENQMTSTANVNYLYDGDGRRVQKSNGKLYWYGMGSEVLDETDLTGSTTNSSFNEYIFFGGKRIARRDSSGNVFYYFADHLGTSRTIAEIPSGQNTATLCYDADFYPYGGERSPIVNTCSQNYKFTGKERDSESGLDNFRARYNSSSVGRFMSPDPLGGHQADPQTLNRYAYVRNNPLNLTDPTGLDFYLSCNASIGGHSTWSVGRCTQVKIGKKQVWVQADKNGKAVVVTSASLQDPKSGNKTEVNQNGVQITTANGTSQGIFISGTAAANGIQGTGALRGFSFDINGNCGGTCLSSGEWHFNASSFSAIGDLLNQRGAFSIPLEDEVAFLGYGAHPFSTQYRFGGPLNSPHLSVPYDRAGTVILDPMANVPQRSGAFHVDPHSNWLDHAIDVVKAKLQ